MPYFDAENGLIGERARLLDASRVRHTLALLHGAELPAGLLVDEAGEATPNGRLVPFDAFSDYYGRLRAGTEYDGRAGA